MAQTMPMDLQAALAFVGSHDRTVLSTRRKDGRPQMSPVNSGLVDGAVCISSRAPLAKVRNIRRDPDVSVLIFTKEFFGSWVQIDGQAEIVDQPEALDLLETVYRTIAGEHPDWDEYRQAMVRDRAGGYPDSPRARVRTGVLRQATAMTGTTPGGPGGNEPERGDGIRIAGFRRMRTTTSPRAWFASRLATGQLALEDSLTQVAPASRSGRSRVRTEPA